MKIPSLTRIPQYKRFEITPRYYDPIKEDIEERTERIRQELRLQQSSGRIPLQRDFLRHKREDRQATVIQLLVVLALVGTIAGYLFLGNNVFYYFLILVPFYIFFRRRTFFRHK